LINLGRGEPVLLADFVRVVEELGGRRAVTRDARMPAADVRQNFADVSKARRLLGYAPRTSVREGVAQLHAWYAGRLAPDAAG
ncbi:MAG: epimerase, partial [Polyangiales bacterium]